MTVSKSDAARTETSARLMMRVPPKLNQAPCVFLELVFHILLRMRFDSP